MSDKTIKIEIDLDQIMNNITIDDIILHFGIEKILQHSTFNNFVNFSKVDESTYDKLVELINKGNLNLELLVGKIAMQKFMNIAENKINSL